jgi:hypothetical protein
MLILAGGYILARGISWRTRAEVLDLGGVRVSTQERHPVPEWVGGLVAIVGLALVFAPPPGRS